MVSLPPQATQREWGLQHSVRVPFSWFLLRLFPLLQHAPSSWATVLFYSNVGTARLQLPLAIIYLLQCGILHGLSCGYLLHCGLCSSTWSISSSFSNHSVSGIVCSTLSSSLLRCVFIMSYINSPRDTTNSSAKFSCVLQWVHFVAIWNWLSIKEKSLASPHKGYPCSRHRCQSLVIYTKHQEVIR